MKKILSIALISSLLFCFSACGDTTNENSNTDSNAENSVAIESSVTESEDLNASSQSFQDIIIEESGYSVRAKSSDVYMHFGVTVTNPNTSFAAEYPVITITAKSADGTIIATDDQTLYTIAPGDTVSIGGLVSCNNITPDTVEFTCYCANYIDASLETYVLSSDLLVSNTSELSGSSHTSFTGEVENAFDADVDCVAITLILKNNGEVVYGDNTFVYDLTTGSKKAFEFTESNLPEYTEYVITAQAW